MPKRVQLSRQAGYRTPDNCVRVCRPSDFGNPFYSAQAFRLWLVEGIVSPADLIAKHWLPFTDDKRAQLETKRQRILSRMPELAGKDVGCYCDLDLPFGDCHADVYIELANQQRTEVPS